MTCIVGWLDKENKKTILAADRFLGNGYVQYQAKSNCKLKQITHNNEKIIIGLTGSPRISQVLSASLKLPDFTKDKTKDHWVYVDFVDAVRTALRDGGCLETKNGVDEIIDGTSLLVAWRDRLFHLQCNFHAEETADRYLAAGSGMYFALGALNVLNTGTIEERLKKAVLTAGKYSPYVDNKVDFLSLEW